MTSERNKKGNFNFVLMMEKRGLDAATLEERSGVGIDKIAKFMRGKKDINRAWAYTAYRLAKALKCNIGDILNHGNSM